MTADITPQLVAWLKSNSALTSLVNSNIGAMVFTEDDWPAIQIGPVTGNPRSDATSQVDTICDWQVAFYIHGGRRNAGRSDMPDHRTTSSVAGPLIDHIRDNTPWTFEGIQIKAARIVSAATGIDPNTLGARYTLTLALTTVPV